MIVVLVISTNCSLEHMLHIDSTPMESQPMIMERQRASESYPSVQILSLLHYQLFSDTYWAPSVRHRHIWLCKSHSHDTWVVMGDHRQHISKCNPRCEVKPRAEKNRKLEWRVAKDGWMMRLEQAIDRSVCYSEQMVSVRARNGSILLKSKKGQYGWGDPARRNTQIRSLWWMTSFELWHSTIG